MTEESGNPQTPFSVIDQLTDLQVHPALLGSRINGRASGLEDCLSRVLRPHDEAGFQLPDDNWMIEIRDRLDNALELLTLQEIRNQLRLFNEELPADTRQNLAILFRSEAFLRYLNAYLYFGIRFLASRTDSQTPAAQREARCADANSRPFVLSPPPPPARLEQADQFFEGFVKLKDVQAGTAVWTALRFLDDFHLTPKGPAQYEMQEPCQYELYLRGLRPETEGDQKDRFETISQGLTEWALKHSEYYLSLEPPKPVVVQAEGGEEAAFERPGQGWLVTNPIAARLALSDIYWIARLLRADVSSTGEVTYHKYNWLHLLRFHAVLVGDLAVSRQLEKAEEALRSAFDFVCDLIQNSIEITREEAEREPGEDRRQDVDKRSSKWRAVFDEELDEIASERRIRHFLDPSLAPEATAGPQDVTSTGIPLGSQRIQQPAGSTEATAPPGGSAAGSTSGDPSGGDPGAPPSTAHGGSSQGGWSKRIITGEVPRNLIGLAFSGGGIRSATFNLGVLQGLQELDLLRYVDYLSTVSGGGFIGSWLVGNVRRTSHWLGRLTDWSNSIAHLRAHSNYLAPRTGILSADTWNLGNSWFRNAFLIQLTGLAWLFVLLLASLLGFRLFLFVGNELFGLPVAAYIVALTAVILAIAVPYNLHGAAAGGRSRRSRWVRRLAVTPGWMGACALAAHLWANADCSSTGWPELYGINWYSGILLSAWRPWRVTLAAALIGFLILSIFTLRRRMWHSVWISPFCTIVLYLELAGIFLAFRTWSLLGDEARGLGFVFGPSLVLIAFSVCVLLIIGFTGRNTDEARREWWTRLGTWLGIFAGVGLFVCGTALYGPYVVLHFLSWTAQKAPGWISGIKWAAVTSWLGTVIGGLFAGKSSRTDGTSSPGLQKLAQAGGVLFILGSFLFGSTLLCLLMLEIFATAPVTDPASVPILWELAIWKILLAFTSVLMLGSLFSFWFEINIFGLNQFYRNRLVQCYLGATRWTPGARNPNPFTRFDFRDDLSLWRFRTDSPGVDPTDRNIAAPECQPYRGPLPILNCSLNLGGSADLALNTRHSASFSMTPLRVGCDRARVGYAPTWSRSGSFADGVPLGQAVSVSGAAVSSNMGYNTSPVVAFLLTMFNVRLGWWFPNPSSRAWRRRGLSFSLYYLLMELFGIADEKRYYLNVSDGGHFENLAVYELIRRRCKLIIACDAECDEGLQFGGLGNLIRICETDFGAKIDLDVKSIRPNKDGHSLAHCAVGTIKYSSGEIGRLIYLKASMTGDEDVSIAQYRSSHLSFPHESTSNQFYSEDQFESYRKLGLHVVRSSFRGSLPGDDPLITAERMVDLLTPAGCPSGAFLKHSAQLRQIWERCRAPELLSFMAELVTTGLRDGSSSVTSAELGIGLELIQLMEDVFLDLRLDDFWEHPDNRGWAILFMRWARSPRFRQIWNETHRTFGIRFEYFCHSRLGLRRDRPVARV